MSILELSQKTKTACLCRPLLAGSSITISFLGYSKCLSVEELGSPEEDPGPINLVEVQGW